MKTAVFLTLIALSTQALAETGAAFATTSKAGTIQKKNSQKKSENKKQAKDQDAVFVTSQTKKSGESSIFIESTNKHNMDKISIEVLSDKDGNISVIEGFASGKGAYKSTTLEVGAVEKDQVATLLAFIDNMQMRDLIGEMIVSAKQNTESNQLRKKAKKLDFNDYVAGMYSTHDAFAELATFNESSTKKNN